MNIVDEHRLAALKLANARACQPLFARDRVIEPIPATGIPLGRGRLGVYRMDLTEKKVRKTGGKRVVVNSLPLPAREQVSDYMAGRWTRGAARIFC